MKQTFGVSYCTLAGYELPRIGRGNYEKDRLAFCRYTGIDRLTAFAHAIDSNFHQRCTSADKLTAGQHADDSCFSNDNCYSYE
jgi:hypothetical protein